MSRERRSRASFATAVGSSLFSQFVSEGRPGEPCAQWTSMRGWAHSDVIVMAPEADFVAGFDAELIT